MRIAIVGTGYVGLVSAACFSELGHHVIGIDIDEAKVKMLKQGQSPIYEPGLEELIRTNLKKGHLEFTTDLLRSLPKIDVLFSAVATPPGKGHHADLRAVFTVAETVASHAEKPLIFVNKSTVPVGTGKECEKRMQAILQKRHMSLKIPVISNPEFLREGMAVPDTMMPDRVVVGMSGENTQNAKAVMEDLFRPITRVGKPIVFMSRESAEIVKYASNAFLATKISFINMLTELCEKTDGDIRDVARGMGLDHRIGPKFLHAGIGYGGSCFPKDVKALMATAKQYRVPMPIVEAVDSVNAHQRKRFIQRVLNKLPKKSRVAIWGLSFKPKTDDMREAPSIDVIQALIKHGHTVAAFDPAAMPRAKALLPKAVRFMDSPQNTAKKADALLLLTEWDEFRGVDLQEIRSLMEGNLLFDGRNVYEKTQASAAGFSYHGIGVK